MLSMLYVGFGRGGETGGSGGSVAKYAQRRERTVSCGKSCYREGI